MSVRKILAGVATATLAASAISLSAGAAHAADVVDPDDTTFVATTNDLIGVGSDTSQHAIKLFADAANASGQLPAGVRVATFAATGGGNIPLPSGTKARPNGSGAGKSTLYGAGNNTDIDFARSSSAQNTAETQAGLKSFPFALDTLVMAVSNSTPSNAPAALTPAQIVGIYKGDITNWSQIDPAKSGVIAPKIPQAGSGTRSFFEAQLKSLNGGVAVALAASVKEVQEHDDSAIKNDANAIAPFSQGRAGLLGTTLRLETGWKADRALYNVVRGTDLGNPLIQGLFGEDGALCSTAVRPLIEQAGFKQLATPANGGVCGQATSDATSNFTLNEQVVTATSLAATSPKAKSATLVAKVTASTSPSGSVDFFEGDTEIASNVPLVSGAATFNATGEHTYTAVFDPGASSTFESSQDDATVTVKTSASVSESFPASTKAKSAKGTITVVGDGATATGTVTLMRGKTELKTTGLSGGKATFTVKLVAGKNKLKAVYSGNGAVAGASKSFTITKKK
jgi:ABC-type phosphate transport system substrate-binding protein